MVWRGGRAWLNVSTLAITCLRMSILSRFESYLELELSVVSLALTIQHIFHASKKLLEHYVKHYLFGGLVFWGNYNCYAVTS